MAEQSVRVLIPTSSGLVEIESLKKIQGLDRSVACIGNTTQKAGIDETYNAFVSREYGLIERFYGKRGYRLDVSGPVSTGSSWQLATFVAHALHDAGRLAERGAPTTVVLWATGLVRPLDLTVGDVGHVAQKLQHSIERLKRERSAGKRVIVAWPKANMVDVGNELRQELSCIGVEVHEVAAIEQLLSAIDLVLPALAADPEKRVWKRNPYRGLERFEAEHREIFFGRGRAREEALERLRRAAIQECSFLLIKGRSGAGKSSLVRAGLIGDIIQGASEAENWQQAILAPLLAAASPLVSLAEALLEKHPKLGESPDALARLIVDQPGELARRLLGVLASSSKRTKLILLIDQLEELFTWVQDQGPGSVPIREAFAGELGALARTGSVWVIATLRSDLDALIEESPALSWLASEDRTYRLERPSRADLKEMILRPAEIAGLRFEGADAHRNSFSELLIDAATAAPDSLPLLQFVLARIFESDGGRGQLTYATYDRLGGLEGAIGRWADKALESMGRAATEHRMLDRVLLDLAEIDRDGGATRARTIALTSVDATSDQRNAVIEALVKARLVIVSGAGRERAARVAHEAVLSHWPHAIELFREHSADLKLRDRMEESAAAWLAEGRDPSFLLTPGRSLQAAQDLIARSLVAVSETVREYVVASMAKADADSARERDKLAAEGRKDRLWRQRAVFAAAAMFVLAVVATGLLLVSASMWKDATRERDRALATESLFLSDLSRKALSQNNVVDATLLALEALPNASSNLHAIRNRPSIKEAENALARALGSLRRVTQYRLDGDGMPPGDDSISPDRKKILVGVGATPKTDEFIPARLWDVDKVTFLHLAGVESSRPTDVEWSRDSTRIAANVQENEEKSFVGVWDTSSGQLIRRFDGYALIALSPAGDRILVSDGGRKRLLRISDSEELPITLVGEIEFSPDGQRLLETRDNETVVYDASTGAVVAALSIRTPETVGWTSDPSRLVIRSEGAITILNTKDGHAVATNLPAIKSWVLQNSHYVVALSSDCNSSVWNAETGDLIQRIECDGGLAPKNIHEIIGRTGIIVETEQGFESWQLRAGRYARVAKTNFPFSESEEARGTIGISPDGKWVVRTGEQKIDITPLAFTEAYLDSWEPIYSAYAGRVEFTNDSRSLIVITSRGVEKVEILRSQMVGRLTDRAEPSTYDACSPSCRMQLLWNHGKFVLVSPSSETNPVALQDVPIAGKPEYPPIKSTAWSSDETRILMFLEDAEGDFGSAAVWDTRSGARVQFLTPRREVGEKISHRPDLKVAAIGSGSMLRLIGDDGSPLDEIETSEMIVGMAWREDGKQIALLREGGHIEVWDLDRKARVSKINPSGDTVNTVVWNKSGAQIAVSVGKHYRVELFDAASGERVHVFQKDEVQAVTGIVFGKNDTRVVTYGTKINQMFGFIWAIAGWDKDASLWDAISGKLIAHLKSDVLQPVSGIQFSVDGDLVATSAASGAQFNVWDSDNGKRLLAIEDSGTEGVFGTGSDSFVTFGGSIETWKVPRSVREGAAGALAVIKNCIGPASRERLKLPAAVPDWCPKAEWASSVVP